MKVLEVSHLCKYYDKFHLEDVSFAVEEGEIMGFIGRNGAGKTTTLKSILNLIHLTSGEVKVFEKDYLENELECKEKIGFVLGGVDYYPKTKIKKLTAVTKRFYKEWDQGMYDKYIQEFELDEEKRVSELSAGMRVKYMLAIALSHHAKLLILDEPTSGLDPISRDEILDIFEDLSRHQKISILFSTHITSDLEKCANSIAFIKKGRLVSTSTKQEFLNSYLYLEGKMDAFTKDLENNVISYRLDEDNNTFTALIKKDAYQPYINVEVSNPSLETIMIYSEKKEAKDEKLTA